MKYAAMFLWGIFATIATITAWEFAVDVMEDVQGVHMTERSKLEDLVMILACEADAELCFDLDSDGDSVIWDRIYALRSLRAKHGLEAER